MSKNIVKTISDGLRQTRKVKLEQSVKDIQSVDDSIGRIVTVLEGDSDDRRQAVKSLRAMSNILHKIAEQVKDAAREADQIMVFEDQQEQIIEVATAQFKEDRETLKKVAEIIQSSGYDLAHFETFMANFQEYMIGSPPVVRMALELMDAPVVQQEAASLPRERRLELIKALDPTAVKE